MTLVPMFVEELLRPVSLVSLLLLLALAWRKRRVPCLIAAILVLVVFGSPALPSALSKRLVTRYDHVTHVDADVGYVVVLAGGGFATDEAVPANCRATPEYLYRFLEGVRLLRSLPDSKMVLSIGQPDEVPQADLLAQELAKLVGIESHRIKTAVGARSTSEEAQLVREIVGETPFYLVTSDYHLPRAMLIFSQNKLDPIPAPAGSCGKGDGERPLIKSVFPNSRNLSVADRNWHEYLGGLWENLNSDSGEK